jgi:hypothetical protein
MDIGITQRIESNTSSIYKRRFGTVNLLNGYAYAAMKQRRMFIITSMLMVGRELLPVPYADVICPERR